MGFPFIFSRSVSFIPQPSGDDVGPEMLLSLRFDKIGCGELDMANSKAPHSLLPLYLLISLVYQCSGSELGATRTASLQVNASEASGQPISETFFGLFFEEINHAGAGGIWAELVSNRALRIDVLCDSKGPNSCPPEGVGVYNPGYWGMNIEQGKSYKVAFYVRSTDAVNISVALTGSNGLQKMASTNIIADDGEVSDWIKKEFLLEAKGSDSNSRLQLTTTRKGVIWFDQVSVMPLDTYTGHGFRTDLVQMLADLKPRFFRFPGGCFVEGEWLRNAFRWKETVGPWEERPGHFGDVWSYWTDDGIGYFEFLQEALDGIEFARGSPNSKWGSLRAAMGHQEPFDLRYVAIGNEDCGKKNYRGNYLKFYDAIKSSYPDIQIITNCDASSQPLDHPADLYDYHVYTSSSDIFSRGNHFDHTLRSGPKAFVSEYAVTGKDAGRGSFLAALGEAGFLIGLEKNRWNPDAIVFNSSKAYGTPSYWVQRFFTESSGATLLKSTLQTNSYASLLASAISFRSSEDDETYLKIKIVNFGSDTVNLKIAVNGLDLNTVRLSGSSKTVFTSSNLMDENSFNEPTKVGGAPLWVGWILVDLDLVLLCSLPYVVCYCRKFTKITVVDFVPLEV
ncbi:Alpha-L-arabinofuranosidase 1 [Morus notabilis]|uniref:non-reducing end alpha-L-arabinofuranosidase n=1 Tax=Morus notabilis TaxID=981085 RepID=W9SI03_9ROSA|nr:Alpha-L-arabinofuranosidase 1 [Morus notabilis]